MIAVKGWFNRKIKINDNVFIISLVENALLKSNENKIIQETAASLDNFMRKQKPHLAS